MNECCGNCIHSRFDLEAEDFVCNNAESEYFADYVELDTICDEWETK